jgi:hypothetical protein
MRIDPLAQSEVKRYLQTRWTRACTQHSLPFSEDAIETIACSSAGIPRVINAICDAALVNAYGTDMCVIGRAQVQEVLQDLGIAVINHSSVGGSSTRALPNYDARTIDRMADRPPALKPLERYIPSAPKSPKPWRIANWFGTAHSGAK